MTTPINKPVGLRSWFVCGSAFALRGGLLLVLLMSGCGRNGVSVTVANTSGGQLNQIQVHYTGGTNSIPSLAPGESRTCKVNPTAASSIGIEFIDAAGGKHSNKVDVYLERNYGGAIVITIGPSNKVLWKDRVKI